MLKFTFKFIKSLSIFFWRIFLILVSLVFPSIANAFLTFFESESKSDLDSSEFGNITAIDELTALNSGLSELEMGNYWGLGEKEK